MKKVTYALIIIIVILILIVFVWPYIMGVSLRSQVFEMSKISMADASQPKMKVVDYHVGWLKSNMVLQYSIPIPKNLQLGVKNLVANIKLDVINGPISKLEHPLTHKTWGWGRAAASGNITIIQPSANQHPDIKVLARPISFEAWVNWNGSIDMHTELPAGVIYQNKAGLAITSDKIVEDATINKALTAISSIAAVNHLQIKQGPFEAVISSIDVNSQLKKGLAGLWYGSQQYSVPQVSVINGATNVGQIQNIKLEASQSLNQNQNLLARLLFTIDKVNVQGENFGPIKLDFSANHFQPKILAQLAKQLKALTPQIAALQNKQPNPAWTPAQKADFNAQQEAQFEALLTKMKPTLVEIFTGVEIRLNTFFFATPMGNVQASGYLAFPDQFNGAMTDPDAMEQLILASRANMKYSVSKQLVLASSSAAIIMAAERNKSIATPEQKAAFIQKNMNTLQTVLRGLIKEGVIKQDQTNYLAELSYHDKRFFIFNKAITPEWVKAIETGVFPTQQNTQAGSRQNAHQPRVGTTATGSSSHAGTTTTATWQQ